MNDRLEIRPDVCNGKPVVRGTRITAQTILELLAAGDSVDEVVQAFPRLQREDVLACLELSAALAGHEWTTLSPAA